jgi:hypothetical protein
MNPELFTQQMQEALIIKSSMEDEANTHRRADELMCEYLRWLGYGEGIDLFEESTRWYE